MGAKEGRSCKGATRQHHEDRPEKVRPHLRWSIGSSTAGSVQMFQIPGPPVHKRLFKAVLGAHHGACRERLRLTRSEEENRSGDVTLALADHARHHSRQLKPGESLFGGPGVQTTVGLIDGYQSSIHDLWTHGG